MAETDKENDERFDRIVHEYYQAVEAGESVDPEAFICQHSDHERQLRSFFADLHALGDLPGLGAMERTINQSDSRSSQAMIPSVSGGDRITYIGQYRLVDEIARGGMGVVFKARQEKLSRIVALKMILSGPLASSTEIDRFRREARAAARLQHPNIVSVHEIGQHDGHYFFTMDFVESESLGERLREGSLSPEESARLVETIARAMHYAHGEGVLHRDLKPANILIDKLGQPHITDFGLAKAQADAEQETLQEMTRTGQVLGTPSYMSPEQASGKSELVDVRSDVYSLGAILYACLAGRAPFVGESSIETLQRVIHEEPPRVRLLNNRVSKDLENVCHKALSKEPKHRYATAEELADDLLRYREGRPVLARPVPATTRIYRWYRRHPAAAVLIALLTFLGIFIPINAVMYARYESFRAEHEEFLRSKADRETKRAMSANRELQESLRREERARKQAEQSRNSEKYARNQEVAARKEAEMATAREKAARKAIERSAEEARWKTYVARMTVARQPWCQGELGQLAEQLQLVVPDERDADLRGWEWGYYQNQIHQLTVPISVSGIARKACWSRDGRFIITGGTRLEIWDASTLQRIYAQDFGLGIHALCLSPDDKQLAVGMSSGTITLLDFQTRKLSRQWKAHSEATNHLSFSPDGKRIASATLWGASRIWNTGSGEQLHELTRRTPENYLRNVNWNPHKDLIAISDRRGFVKVFNATTGKIVFEHRASGISCNVASWRPDGEVLIGGAAFPNYTIFTYSIDGKILRKFELSASIVSWSPDGKRLAVGGSDQDLRIVEMSSGEVLGRLRSHASSIKAVRWSPSGERILSVDDDGKVRLSQVDRKHQVASVAYRSDEHSVRSIRLSQDGKELVGACGDNRLRIWRTKDFRLTQTSPAFSARIRSVTWSPDREQLICGCADNQIRSWRVDSSEISSHFDPKLRGGGVNLWVDWRPGTDQIALGEHADDTHLFDLATNRLLRRNEVRHGFGRWNPDGTRLAVGKLVLDRDLNEVGEFNESNISKYAWSPNGRLIAHGSANGDIAIYDSYNDVVLKRIKAHRNVITSVAWNPSGTRIASGDSEGELRLWDAATLDKVWQVETSKEVNSLAWTQDGLGLVSAGGLPETADPTNDEDAYALCVWNSSSFRQEQESVASLSTAISRAAQENLISREITQWILNSGGAAEVRTQDQLFWARSMEQLPSGPFELVSIDLSACEVGETELLRCADVGTVTQVNLRETSVRDETMLQLLQSLTSQSVLDLDFTHRHFELSSDGSVRPKYTPEEELARLTEALRGNPVEGLRNRARWYVNRLQWDRALSDFESFLTQRPHHVWVRCETAIVAWMAGERNKYRRGLPDIHAVITSTNTAERRIAILATMLAPDSLESAKEYSTIAEEMAGEGKFYLSFPYFLTLLRCDEHERLLTELDGDAYFGHSQIHANVVQHAAMRAICLHRLGRVHEASEQLLSAENTARQCWPESDSIKADIGDVTGAAFAQQLLKEARAMIAGNDTLEAR